MTNGTDNAIKIPNPKAESTNPQLKEKHPRKFFIDGTSILFATKKYQYNNSSTIIILVSFQMVTNNQKCSGRNFNFRLIFRYKIAGSDDIVFF